MKLLRNFLPKYSLNQELLKESFFPNEQDEFAKIPIRIANKKLKIYYPGAADDVASILVLLKNIAPKCTDLHIIMLDIRDFYDGIIYQLERYTNPYIQRKKSKIIAYYKDKRITVSTKTTEFAHYKPPKIDIYFERAFQMFREHDRMSLYEVCKQVKGNGFMMSDYGFDFASKRKDFKKINNVPTEIGLYAKFQIWQKQEEQEKQKE